MESRTNHDLCRRCPIGQPSRVGNTLEAPPCGRSSPVGNDSRLCQTEAVKGWVSQLEPS
jgi:hypothetical protein